MQSERPTKATREGLCSHHYHLLPRMTRSVSPAISSLPQRQSMQKACRPNFNTLGYNSCHHFYWFEFALVLLFLLFLFFTLPLFFPFFFFLPPFLSFLFLFFIIDSFLTTKFAFSGTGFWDVLINSKWN